MKKQALFILFAGIVGSACVINGDSHEMMSHSVHGAQHSPKKYMTRQSKLRGAGFKSSKKQLRTKPQAHKPSRRNKKMKKKKSCGCARTPQPKQSHSAPANKPRQLSAKQEAWTSKNAPTAQQKTSPYGLTNRWF